MKVNERECECVIRRNGVGDHCKERGSGRKVEKINKN